MWAIADLGQWLAVMDELEIRQYLYYVERANNLKRSHFPFSDSEMARYVQALPSAVRQTRTKLRQKRLINYSYSNELIIYLKRPRKFKLPFALKGGEMILDEWRCPICGSPYLMLQKYGRVEKNLAFGAVPSELFDEKYMYVCVGCGTGFRGNEDLQFTEVIVFIVSEQVSAKRRVDWVIQKLIGSKYTIQDMGKWKKLTDTAYAFEQPEWEEFKKSPQFNLYQGRYTVKTYDLTDPKYYDRLARAEVEAELDAESNVR